MLALLYPIASLLGIEAGEIVERVKKNGVLWGAIALSVVLQVAVVELSFLNDAFGTTHLTLEDWLICLGLASVVLWADEAKKLLERALNG